MYDQISLFSYYCDDMNKGLEAKENLNSHSKSWTPSLLLYKNAEFIILCRSHPKSYDEFIIDFTHVISTA
jgi:hypothetical protein